MKNKIALSVVLCLLLTLASVASAQEITGTFDTDWAGPALNNGIELASQFGPLMGVGLILLVGAFLMMNSGKIVKGWLPGRR